MKRQILSLVLLLGLSSQTIWAQHSCRIPVKLVSISDVAAETIPESEKCWNRYSHNIDVWKLQAEDMKVSPHLNSLHKYYSVNSKIISSPENPDCVFFLNMDNELLEAHYTNSKWVANTISGNLNVSQNFNISQSGQEVFLSTSDHSLIQLVRLSDFSWSQKVFLADFENRDGSMIKVDNIKSDIQIADNPRKIFYIADDNSVWNLYFDEVWRANTLNCAVNNVANNLVLNDPTGGSVSYISTSGNIEGLHWNKCENPNPICAESENSKSDQKEWKIKSEDIESSISIYPNPVKDILHVRFDTENPIGDIYLYTLQGQLIQTISSENKDEVRVDFSRLAPGGYILKTNSENTLITKYTDK